MQLFPPVPQDQTFWYLAGDTPVQRLTTNSTADIVVVGGGMAGLSAAHAFRQQGLSVILLEKNYCGSGATGKSSGFITPDSELPLSHFVKKYGIDEGKRIWEFILSGVADIHTNITTFNLDCGYFAQKTCLVANTRRKFSSEVLKEHTIRQSVGYPSTLYTGGQLGQILGSDSYHGALTYGDTFGIQAYDYCQGMKNTLRELGVKIYEESPVIAIQSNKVSTDQATVTAGTIVVCTDRFVDGIKPLETTVYHAQTALMLSAPLSDAQVKRIFPQEPLLVWDTDLVYHYYRLTRDNRLLLGGGSLLQTYGKNEQHANTPMIKKLTRYFERKFPDNKILFEYTWPGLIGISRDFFPVAGFDRAMPSVYYIAAAGGLPWAAALGKYSVDRIIHNQTSFDHYFSPYRPTQLGGCLNAVLGKKISFALSNFLVVGSL